MGQENRTFSKSGRKHQFGVFTIFNLNLIDSSVFPTGSLFSGAAWLPVYLHQFEAKIFDSQYFDQFFK